MLNVVPLLQVFHSLISRIMNDREISDFDKLKNLLTEFGLDYGVEEDDILTVIYVLVRNRPVIDFCFTKQGEFDFIQE